MSNYNFWKNQAAIITSSEKLFESPEPNNIDSIVPSGYMKFDNLSAEDLLNFRIIPEEGNSLITPTGNRLYCGDGFYWSLFSNERYWYKVSDGGGVIISKVGNNIGFGAIINGFWKLAAEKFGKEYFIGWKPKSDPHWVKNPFDV